MIGTDAVSIAEWARAESRCKARGLNYRVLHKIVKHTSAGSNFSVIPARVSGAREESRIPLQGVGKDRDSSRGSRARE